MRGETDMMMTMLLLLFLSTKTISCSGGVWMVGGGLKNFNFMLLMLVEVFSFFYFSFFFPAASSERNRKLLTQRGEGLLVVDVGSLGVTSASAPGLERRLTTN